MKSILLKFSLFLAVLFTFSCSNDDSEDNPIDENGGVVSRYQIVTIDTESVSLSDEEYNGTLGGKPIQLSKTGDHELVFYVAGDASLGENELIITDLNNTKIKYEVVDAVLSQSVTETLTPFFTNFEDFNSGLSSTVADADYISNYNNMVSYYDNLSEGDKTEVARFYQVNKTIIDAVFLSDYSNVTAGRAPMSEIDMAANKLLVLKFKAALAVGIVGGTVAVLEPSNIIRPIAIGVAIAGISSALDYHFDLIDNNVNIIQLKINSILGTNGRTTNAVLSFTDDVAKTVPFNIGAQQIVDSDSGSQQEYMKLYFETKNKLNAFVAKVNTSIQWVNNNIPLVSFSTIPLVTLPDTVTPEGYDVNNQIMQNLTLSINHPNLILESANLQSDGMLNIKIKINGTPSSLPVSTTLNYSYADDFSNFSGSFDIEVNNTPQYSGQIQFTLSGSGLVFPDTSNVIYPLYNFYVDDEAGCDFSNLRFMNDVGDNVFFYSNKLIELMNSPIGTVFQFSGEYNCYDGNYINFTVDAQNGTYTTDGFNFSEYGFSSVFGEGTFIKTGANTFSFSGTMPSTVGSPDGGVYTAQISGTGTFYP
ncbi:hypothetical protein E0W68_04605 [Flavobacterium salilacus subsp. salilacus]|uniref:hypothetical protein n=1 Tax=Flavobacterium TaxID=237 RepID=UPI0010755BCC|nr:MULTISPECIES: hypothetical protein [Flavobacterium]KAF2519631.1 hypothetical protein E0W68_04605 [Flavobacterium salilacus subsp. salilacus]MBE1614467.1 hypothetical protein [Flavobacterium sp. SaA2.13]